MRDLMNQNEEWNFYSLSVWLLRKWICKLRSCAPPSTNYIADCFCFAGTTQGFFSIKAMYQEMEESDGEIEDEDWKNIWKVVVPERCRTFLWLLKHDRLLTNFSKSKKGLGYTGCSLCGNFCETTIHALRDFLKCVPPWKSIVPSDLMVEFFTSNFKEWIHLNLSYRNARNKWWSDFWVMANHTLWYWRNLEEHDITFERPYNLICHIFRRKQDYASAIMTKRHCHGEEGSNMFMGWKPLTIDTWKLNTDGASKWRQKDGCGGIIRDSSGVWRGSFSKYLGRCSAIVIEFLGVLEGLKYTLSLGIRRVEVNMDASIVVKAIEEGVTGMLDYVSILRQINELIDLHDLVVISYVHRSTNMCAYALANRGCLDKSDPVHLDAPEFLWPLMAADL